MKRFLPHALSLPVFLFALAMPGVGVLGPIILICGLIFIHELGHFLMAKRMGMPVETFSLGFGPYKALRVGFRKVDHKLETVGAFTKERQWTLRDRIEVANEGADALEVVVQDRILKPVSGEVKITLGEGFTPGWTETVPGVRVWNLKLGAQEKKTFELPVTVRAPMEGIVTGME